MAIKHGTITAPTGVTITGTLIHEKRTREEDVSIESMDSAGAFSVGKSIRKRVNHTTSGEKLTTAALPTVGSGAGSSSSPHVDSVESTERNEGAEEYTVEDHYFAAGVGDWS